MPQQPASSTSSSRPGTAARAVEAPVEAGDGALVAVRVKDRLAAGGEAQPTGDRVLGDQRLAQARRSGDERDALVARQQARPVVAHHGVAARLDEGDGAPGRGVRRERRERRRRGAARLVDLTGGERRPAAAPGVYDGDAAAARRAGASISAAPTSGSWNSMKQSANDDDVRGRVASPRRG